MVRIYTRRKERTIAQYILVVSVSALLCVACAEENWGKCVIRGDQEQSAPRNLRVGSPLNITLEMSSRITHQLSTHIYRILLQEKLGYARVKIIYKDDYDPGIITERFKCFKEVDGDLDYIVPETMINLEVPVPPEFNNDQFCITDLGTIGPPGYFGWFVPIQVTSPLRKHISGDMSDIHWTTFREVRLAKLFDMSDEYKTFINEYVHTPNQTNSYYCDDPRCTKGWYIPDACKRDQCAVLLAPDYETTKEVIDHIKEMKILVKVAWVGPKLKEVSSKLIKKYNKGNINKSFMIFSWAPSDVIFKPEDYWMVTMTRCDIINGSASIGCFYGKRRSVKYAWRELPFDNPAIHILRQMNFLEDASFEKLLQIYEQQKANLSISEIACKWVNEQEGAWEEWLPLIQKKISIGGIFPLSGSAYTGKGIVRGATMAKDAINLNKTLLKGYDLELLVADGQCRADKVMKAFIDYLTPDKHKTLVGVLGPACSDTVEPLAGLSKYYKTITISYSAEGAFFSDRDKYPYFLRTIGENKHYKYVYLELLKRLGWKRVAALTEDGQKYTEYISHMQNMLEANHITFISNKKFPRDRDKNMTPYLEDLKGKSARIIIADVFDEIARNVMCEAYKLGMTAKQGYVWFLPTWLNSTWYETTYYNMHLNESLNCTTDQMIEAINGYFSMTHAYYGEDNDTMQEHITIAKWRANYEKASKGVTSNYAGYAYDAVWAYALGLDKLMKEDPEAIHDLHSINVTKKLTSIIKNLDFNGVSGNIKFRGGATRFSVINIMQWYNNSTKIVGRFYPNISNDVPEILGGQLELNTSAIIWLGAGGRIPGDGTPPPIECTLNSLAKFLNVKCEMAIIILNIFIIFFLMISLSTIMIVIKKRYDQKVRSTEKYMKSLGLEHLLLSTDQSGLDKWEIERDQVVLNRKLGEGAFGTVYGGEAALPNSGWTPVAVKTLKIGATTEEKLDFLSEAEVMKRFDHKNIVKLLGVCTKVEPVYTIMEFMLYGDLKTYLLARRHLVHANNDDESEEVSSKKLTSMALDVARGLSYLAELKYVHRDVASRNCLLSGQRVVKLGDFGMTRPTLDNDYYKFNRRGMLPVRWMAPESLALGVFTPSSDVWSYGVLLYEIITFGSFPFQGLSNTQVLDHVKAGNHVTVPQGVKPPLEFLLKTCWTLDPKLRPSASEIVEHLANNSRLISPCLDLPLASVQMEDTAQLEMQLPDQFRKCSSSLSFKNLPLLTAISSMSVHTPTKRQPSIHADTGVSIPMENCCPKEPLLPSRSDSISGCSKYVTIKQMSSDLGCDQDEHENYTPKTVLNGHAISIV